ncbi:MAG TPA: SDR family oxidoreductase [Solirubrobacteraceae bacterium]|jgi:NAD(P)-dependent dehydrogenase (short-subunit alcohol dehydrogenase family)|nr:SDR family oxidoreductase [Solirubrobacteraceae bacterium]
MPKQGEVVVITGASGGVGRAAARKFAADGAKVALLARGRQGLEAAAREVEHAGGQALVLPVDVAQYDQVEAAAASVEDAFGEIDVWVNDAMVTLYAEFLDIEPAEFKRSTEVSYLGMVWGSRAALKRMVPRDRGSLVQVCSAMSYRGIPLQSPYCGAKHACKGFTESVITELLHHRSKVQVSMIMLPGLNTTQFTWGRTKLPKQTMPVAPIYQPEVAADAIHYAAYHKRRQIYVGIPTVMNILGERTAPWLLDRFLAKKGYDGQMTSHDLDPRGHDNLFEPVDEDRGSHGPFDEMAHTVSPQYELSKHRGTVLAGVGAAALGAGVAAALRTGRPS